MKIGVDIGGMSIKVGLVNDKGEIIQKNVVKTADTFDGVMDNLVGQINSVLVQEKIDLSQIEGIGIGCPGLVASKEGVIKSSSNLNWDNAPIVERLKSSFNTKIRVSNDANVAALAEAVYGKVRGVDNAIMITLGTGVGGGIIIDGKLFEGGSSLGAEIGHYTIVHNGRPCGCGRKGCIEQYASASAIIRDTKTAMQNDKSSKMWKFVGGDINKVDGKVAFECSKMGDKSACEVVDNFVAYLGDGIMSLHNIFRSELYIIGGGISAQGDYLTDKLFDYCKRFDFGLKGAPVPQIVVATLGNDAGIIGAAELVNN